VGDGEGRERGITVIGLHLTHHIPEAGNLRAPGPGLWSVKGPRLRFVAVLIAAAAAITGCAAATDTRAAAPRPARAAVTTPPRDTAPSQLRSGSTHAFDRHAHSTRDPSSIWVIVNKTHPIALADFRPDITLVRGYQVARPAAGPLTRLLDAADAAGQHLKIASAYRSRAYQEGVHERLVAEQGQVAADAISARPGYSEHQTGLAVDLEPLDGRCALDQCFAQTTQGRWLAAHAAHFGFVVRYTAQNRKRTGYAPEPWHFRYVGTALAHELRSSGSDSLEEFFGVSGGDYPG
jgi:zinc D-Ala-D-Ala carboxypeptidase